MYDGVVEPRLKMPKTFTCTVQVHRDALPGTLVGGVHDPAFGMLPLNMGRALGSQGTTTIQDVSSTHGEMEGMRFRLQCTGSKMGQSCPLHHALSQLNVDLGYDGWNFTIRSACKASVGTEE